MTKISRTVKYLSHPDAEEDSTPLATVAGDLVFYGGGVAAHPQRGIPEGIKPFDGYPHHWSQINRELTYCYDIMRQVLEKAGSSISDVLKISSFHTQVDDVFEALRMRPEIFGEKPPPSTLVLTDELPVRNARVALETISLVKSSFYTRQSLVSSTSAAPMPPHQRIWGKTIYSKATRGGGFLFTSGRTNNVIGGTTDTALRGYEDFPYQGDHAVESCRLVLDYLRDVLASFNANFSHVVKAEIYLNDMSQISGIDKVWHESFVEDPPARIFIPAQFPTTYSTMEIELIAIDPEGPWDRESVQSRSARARWAWEPEAVRAGPYLFFSGLSATDFINGVAPEAQVSTALPFHDNRTRRELAYIAELIRDVSGSRVTPLRCKFISPELEQLGVFSEAWRTELGTMPPMTAMRSPGVLPVPATAFQLDLIGWVD